MTSIMTILSVVSEYQSPLPDKVKSNQHNLIVILKIVVIKA